MQPLTRTTIQSLFENGKKELNIPNLDAGFIVTPLADTRNLRGICLRRTSARKKKPRFEMCSWCNHVHHSNGTAMFSMVVKGSDERKTFGNVICRNLDCSLRIRNLASDPPSYMNETLHLNNKVQRLQNAIYRWLYRANELYEA